MILKINGTEHSVDIDENMPLLWVLRDELFLVGTKYGCGVGICGACSVLIDRKPVRSCLLRVADVPGEITTIEAVGTPDALHAVQKEWIRQQVAQCGYCQSGQILAAISLLTDNPSPTDEDIDRAFARFLCRCGAYPRIRSAVKSAAATLESRE